MSHRLIERFHAAARPGLHDSAFHYRQYKNREAIQVAALGKAVARIFETATDGAGPPAKIRRDPLVCGKVVGLNLQGQAPQRAPVAAARFQEPPAIALQDGEDPADGIGFRGKSRLHDDRIQARQVRVQDGQQKRFLPSEEMIKAAGIRSCAMQNLRHPGGGVAPLPEQVARRVQQPFPS